MLRDPDALRAVVHITPELESFLAAPERPIVLLPKREATGLSEHIAPGLAEIGCLLPYSPLHDLLLNDFGGPLVATSGNIAGEPVLTDNHEAQARLSHLADAFLHHDRPIVRPADDPVYRMIAGAPRPLRLGRGNAPLELELSTPLAEPVLALGSHMKNTLCLAWGTRAVVSPHIGELDTPRSLDTLAQVAADLQRLYQVPATRLLVDRHPGYGYRRYARDSGLPLVEIWHHHAHASALAWEFPAIEEWIVFAWDGVGLGEDQTLWGGEAFTGTPGRWRHAASMRPFRLPGGDKAGREPWRAAAALLWETGQVAPFAPEPLHLAWSARLNSPASSSVGRLFDAAAALSGICAHARFEGEGPMRLEAEASNAAGHVVELPLQRDALGLWRIDWAPLLPMLGNNALARAERAASFHLSLAQALVEQAQQLRAQTGIQAVGLTGGVFQNRVLAEAAIERLEAAGFVAHLPQRIPVNDAGLSFGQVIEFLHQ
jgi:hydrogenase maturation protein HypF